MLTRNQRCAKAERVMREHLLEHHLTDPPAVISGALNESITVARDEKLSWHGLFP